MIYLTTAANDRDLVRLFGDLAMDVPIQYGDFIFHGKVGGEVVRVCGERKKFSDLVACINDGRHVQQVQSAHEAGFQYYFLDAANPTLYGCFTDGMTLIWGLH